MDFPEVPVINIKSNHQPKQDFLLHFYNAPTHDDETAILTISCLRNTSIVYESDSLWRLRCRVQDAHYLSSLASVSLVTDTNWNMLPPPMSKYERFEKADPPPVPPLPLQQEPEPFRYMNAAQHYRHEENGPELYSPQPWRFSPVNLDHPTPSYSPYPPSFTHGF